MYFRRKFTPIVLACVVLSLATFAFAQNDKRQRALSEIVNQGSSVAWNVGVAYESVSLTVIAPNGDVFKQVFKQGASPVYSPTANRGSSFVNGSFTFELVFSPILSPGVKEQLTQARIDNNSDKVAQDLRKRGLLPEAMVESGTFYVNNGTITTKNDPGTEPVNVVRTESKESKTASPPTKSNAGDTPIDSAQVINDDLIVVGSTCTGFDCVNGEAFGFDTLRLKENNLRINFQDTSSSASFPGNDWRIVANDTSNGGASFLAIEDSTAGTTPFKVAAGAGNNALIVNNSGNVGIGTATPVVEVHIKDGDSSTLRLEQDGSSGFTPQTWDLAGNESNFFVRDVTNGSLLPFRIRPSAPTDSLFIQNNGRVGLGTDAPSTQLDVNGGIRSRSGGFEFPDGSIQTTAATGGGGGGGGGGVILGAGGAQHLFGGGGFIASFSSIAATTDFNSFAIGTNGAAGFLTSTQNIPYNANLSSTGTANIAYRIRYRDADGTATASQVLVELVARDINSVGQLRTTIFNSNTEAGTGFQTITVCGPVGATNFNASTRSMHLNVTMIGTAVSSADFAQIQIYRVATCP